MVTELFKTGNSLSEEGNWVTHGPVGGCTSASAGTGLQKCLGKAEGGSGAQRSALC